MFRVPSELTPVTAGAAVRLAVEDDRLTGYGYWGDRIELDTARTLWLYERGTARGRRHGLAVLDRNGGALVRVESRFDSVEARRFAKANGLGLWLGALGDGEADRRLAGTPRLRVTRPSAFAPPLISVTGALLGGLAGALSVQGATTRWYAAAVGCCAGLAVGYAVSVAVVTRLRRTRPVPDALPLGPFRLAVRGSTVVVYDEDRPTVVPGATALGCHPEGLALLDGSSRVLLDVPAPADRADVRRFAAWHGLPLRYDVEPAGAPTLWHASALRPLAALAALTGWVALTGWLVVLADPPGSTYAAVLGALIVAGAAGCALLGRPGPRVRRATADPRPATRAVDGRDDADGPGPAAESERGWISPRPAAQGRMRP